MCNECRILATKKKNEERKRLGSTARFYIAFKQGYKCARCLCTLDPRALDIDHIVSIAHGGTNDRKNLQAMCKNCHGIKTFEEDQSRDMEEYKYHVKTCAGFMQSHISRIQDKILVTFKFP